MRTVYVGGLSSTTNAYRLREIFSPFGPLADVRVVMRSSTGKCRGFGYVTFQSDSSALSAIQSLDGVILEGDRLRVDLAR